MKKVIAIIGSYRKNGVTDQAIEAILEPLRQKGTKAEKIYLAEKKIEFCTNCRACTNDSPQKKRGRCIFNDDMDKILSEIDNADGLILGSPINFSEVTALMKKFIERLISYTYWPWGKCSPVNRIREYDKKAILITSSSCPALPGRFMMPCALRIMKISAEIVGAKVQRSLYLGAACLEKEQRLSKRQLAMVSSTASLLT